MSVMLSQLCDPQYQPTRRTTESVLSMFSLELLRPSEPLWPQLNFPDSDHGQISRQHFGRARDGSGRSYNPEPT